MKRLASVALAILLASSLGAIAGDFTIPGSRVHTPGGRVLLNQQTFNADGTWVKPAGKYNACHIAGWGGGGSGANRTTTGNSGGGGGGAYVWRLVPFSSLGATETVDVGAGGTAVASSNANGNTGANTTFGSWLTAYGGLGGSNTAAGAAARGGAGGGSGGTGDSAVGGAPGGGGDVLTNAVAIGQTHNAKGDGGGASGGGITSGNLEIIAGKAGWGGAGGGPTASTGPVNGTGGTSQFGGAGGNGDGTTPTAGTQPGGGGGGARNGATSGKGGDGRVVVTCW